VRVKILTCLKKFKSKPCFSPAPSFSDSESAQVEYLKADEWGIKEI
jgi:hypothetical protein